MALEALAWEDVSNSTKWHCFVVADRRSLCGKWALWRKALEQGPEELARVGANECAACRKKLNAKLAAYPAKTSEATS